MSKQLIPLYTQLQGMAQNLPSHMLGPTRWWTQLGMRTSEGGLQSLPAKQLGEELPLGAQQVLTLQASQGSPYVQIYCVTPTEVYDISPFQTNTKLPFYDSTGEFNGTSPLALSPERISATVYENKIFFTQLGLLGGVWKISPRGVAICGEPALSNPLSAAAKVANPSGRYIAHFFDHLFVANVSLNGATAPYRVQWSNLRSFGDWKATRRNEADQYDFLAGDRERFFGITGMHVVNETLFILTSATVNVLRYVGLPRVVRVYEGVAKVGNDFPFGSIEIHGTVWFLSERATSFFVFNGQQAAPRGREIVQSLLQDLTLDPRYRYALRAYHDEREGEIVWAYCGRGLAWGSDSAPNPTKLNSEIVHNYRTGTWYFRPATQANFIDYFPCGGVFSPKPISALSAQIQGLNQSIEDLSYDETALQRPFWIGQWTSPQNVTYPFEIYNDGEARSGVAPTGQLDPYTSSLAERKVLETGDIHFDAPALVKEVESMVLDCRFNPAEAFLRIEVAARKGLSDPLLWKSFDVLVSPTDLPEQRVSLPRCSGRFFRFRFTLVKKPNVKQISTWVWKGFAPYVYGLPQNTNSPEK